MQQITGVLVAKDACSEFPETRVLGYTRAKDDETLNENRYVNEHTSEMYNQLTDYS